MSKLTIDPNKKRVGIIGGGIAGATVAIKLSELGIETCLFERKPSLVYGPPICHLHAGGNLYREIDEQQCIDLLRQSIQSVKLFPHTINIRPTVIAIPKTDKGTPEALLPRLVSIQNHYQQLIDEDSSNKVLGDAQDYYRIYTREALEQLKGKAQQGQPCELDDWMLPFVNNVDLDGLKYPVVLVQEYGWSLFRLASSATMLLDNYDSAHVFLSSEVSDIKENQNNWSICYQQGEESNQIDVDYLINACGYETGTVDDFIKVQRSRLVEFKAAYVTQWSANTDVWPEVIFHGERGTVDGMAQLTPYADGLFQLHGMTDDITLFRDGLVYSNEDCAQPQLPEYLVNKIKKGWNEVQKRERTELAIKHMSRFIPSFSNASVAGKPLYGAQQIPGLDASLRASDVSFHGSNYARIEIVKGSSAIEAALKIIEDIKYNSNIIENQTLKKNKDTVSLNGDEVEHLAIKLAHERGYPDGLAKVSGLDPLD
ncbi:FAD-dependent oxidoreductase [Vibrio algarum]|uniref:FAD-dependent oxidoreductase n=1 Tax=Vibrio algarum TaxID=3020714 RepID=A0ABT4YXU0_9VIBR|nr:FAD-dependent oxidoreductase [Vibrio sp. KJ40-1]MDB1126295.1 FAD-dependent oxidoreductase [Vibrio sp. KJ40-1]